MSESLQSHKTSNQSLAQATISPVGFETDSHSQGIGARPVASRFPAPADGNYVFSVCVSVSTGANPGTIYGGIQKNGANLPNSFAQTFKASERHLLNCSALVPMLAGDYVEFSLYADQAGVSVLGGASSATATVSSASFYRLA